MTRWHRLAAVALASGCSLLACKRRLEPERPKVWDEAPIEIVEDTVGVLAPAWPKAKQGTLDNDLATVWIHEPGSPVAHVRLVLPTGQASPAAVAVLGATLHRGLKRRVVRQQVDVALEHVAGRIELSMHGHRDDLASMMVALAAQAGAEPSRGLEASQRRLTARDETPPSETVAVATLIEQLGGTPSWFDGERLGELTRPALMAAWRDVVDPRGAVLVVHAGAPFDRSLLEPLAEGWTGRGRRGATPSLLGRLRPPIAPLPSDGRHLLVEGPAPNLIASPTNAVGGGVMVIGRVVDLPTPPERAQARLAQRVLQQSFDARLHIAGERGIFIVVIELPQRQIASFVEQSLAEFSETVATRQPRQRLYAAAELWLGARMVESSLHGEDWTALWSASVDLAQADPAIGLALALDAQLMLETEPEQLNAWEKRWMDPRGGEAGWQWVVAGANPRTLRELERAFNVASP